MKSIISNQNRHVMSSMVALLSRNGAGIIAAGQPLRSTFATVNRTPRAPKYPFDPFSWKPKAKTTQYPNTNPSSAKANPSSLALDAEREGLSVDEVIAGIDTTLTPEQREYVEKLKKTARGTSTVRSLYRDVPTPKELSSTGNFISKVAPNAQELIDYALTFVPPRDGPRRSRQKKRMEHRRLQSVHDHHRRIRETTAAEKKAQARRVNRSRKMKQFQREAVRLAEEAVAKGRAPASSLPYIPIGQARHVAKREAFKLMRDKAKMGATKAKAE